MSDLQTRTIGELEKSGAIVRIQDGNHGAIHPKSSDFVASGVPFVMSRNLGVGTVHLDECERISLDQAHTLRVGFAKTGDVLLTHKGTLGMTAIVPAVDPFIVLTPQVTYYRTNPAQLEARYLMYAFQEPRFFNEMMAVGNQSTRPFVSITTQRQLHLTFQPLPAQRKIAAILSAYDDLIENNIRRIQILEEMAQAIYREWFVEFRFPGHEGVRMVDSELGPIPEGWRVQVMGKVADVNARVIRAGNEPGEIHYIDISAVSQGEFGWRQMKYADAPGRARRLVGPYDVIWSTVRPNLRAYALVCEPPANCVASTGFAVLSARSMPWSYLYAVVTTDAFVGYMVNHATGSAYPAVTGRIFEAAPVIVPDERILAAYHGLAAPMLQLIAKLRSMSDNLRQTRDLLLPRLISGEIDVSNLDLGDAEPAA